MGLFSKRTDASVAQSQHSIVMAEVNQRVDALPDTFPDGTSLDRELLRDAYQLWLTYYFVTNYEVQSAVNARFVTPFLIGTDYTRYGDYDYIGSKGESSPKCLEDQVSSTGLYNTIMRSAVTTSRKIPPTQLAAALGVIQGYCVTSLRTSGVAMSFGWHTMTRMEA